MESKVVMLGAGGHARSVMDIALTECGYEFAGCLSGGGERDVLGVPVIGGDELLERLYADGVRKFFVALGDNQLRKKLFDRCIGLGMEPVNIVSRSAQVSGFAKLGRGVCVLRGAVAHTNVVLGDNCIVNTKASLDHDCVVGSHCHISVGVSICGGVLVGEGTLVAPGAVVRDGVAIGAGSVVGMGAVVTKDIPAGVVAYGVPAKVVQEFGQGGKE